MLSPRRTPWTLSPTPLRSPHTVWPVASPAGDSDERVSLESNSVHPLLAHRGGLIKSSLVDGSDIPAPRHLPPNMQPRVNVVVSELPPQPAVVERSSTGEYGGRSLGDSCSLKSIDQDNPISRRRSFARNSACGTDVLSGISPRHMPTAVLSRRRVSASLGLGNARSDDQPADSPTSPQGLASSQTHVSINIQDEKTGSKSSLK